MAPLRRPLQIRILLWHSRPPEGGRYGRELDGYVRAVLAPHVALLAAPVVHSNSGGSHSPLALGFGIAFILVVLGVLAFRKLRK